MRAGVVGVAPDVDGGAWARRRGSVPTRPSARGMDARRAAQPMALPLPSGGAKTPFGPRNPKGRKDSWRTSKQNKTRGSSSARTPKLLPAHARWKSERLPAGTHGAADPAGGVRRRRRTGKIGLHLAIGARPYEMQTHLLSLAMALVGTDLATGTLAPLFADSLIESQMYGIDSHVPADAWNRNSGLRSSDAGNVTLIRTAPPTRPTRHR